MRSNSYEDDNSNNEVIGSDDDALSDLEDDKLDTFLDNSDVSITHFGGD